MEEAHHFAFTSHETALCIIPPRHQWEYVDRLRALYDKAHGAWPPHINLIYPFVQPALLSHAADILSRLPLQHHQHQIKLDVADVFTHKDFNTILLRPDHDSETNLLSELREEVCRALSSPGEGAFHPHMTIGQSQDVLAASHHFLLEKARLLTPVAWEFSQIAILIRDTGPTRKEGPRHMKLWATLDMSSQQLQIHKRPDFFYGTAVAVPKIGTSLLNSKAVAQPSFQYSEELRTWRPAAIYPSQGNDQTVLERLIIASYNVLADFEWPPQSVRHASLLENILSGRASADILVLEEITDHFLPYLLSDERVRQRYPFSTYGPPDQPGLGPLPSLLNILVLSKFPFTWEYLPFQRKHKGCTVVQFPTVGTRQANGFFRPWILAACHLSQGLTNGAVVTKKNEIQRMLDHLSSQYQGHPWILAGDFNLPTSSYTVEASRKKHDISPATVQYLRDIEHSILGAGFVDTWLATRLESGESSDVANDYRSAADTHEGEQGATFDPFVNTLAARLVGTGLNNRPQRYDRILVQTVDQYRPQGFNMFGMTATVLDGGELTYASDHWGIRCLLVRSSCQDDTIARVDMTRIHRKKASQGLSSFENLKQVLDSHGCLPAESDRVKRKEVFQVLEKVLLSPDRPGSESDTRSGLVIKLVPVGSYGLGVWTTTSDIDCLCIGSISTKTFFALAVQRIKRAGSENIRIIRRVRANSGYMLELEVCGISVDLQYCASRSVADSWPDIMRRPATDPIFTLPFQVLAKLKPARDLFYLRRSIPDMGQYRIAHLFIKAWAKARGIYSAKFGFLGGIHISVMLVPICKILALEPEAVSSSDILMTFFHHYAEADWETAVVYDPFFHKDLKYNRSFREPLCLLGWHAPSLNTAFTASVPTVKVVSAEFKRAKDLLMNEGMTWDGLFGSSTESKIPQLTSPGATEFLLTYQSYLKIDAHYWGPSQEKGSRFVGWLESRCVLLLVGKSFLFAPVQELGISARIWPARFVDRSSSTMDNAGNEFHGCYLVGLEWDDEGKLNKEQITITQNSLRSVLQEFEAKIHRDEKYFDSRYSWMTGTVSKSSDLDNLELDHSRWGLQVGEDEDDDDSEDNMDLEDEDEDENTQTQKVRHRTRTKTTRRTSRAINVVKTAGLGKFRSATDVLNRLRWDDSMDSGNYLVGYEDRFKGAQEKEVEEWKGDQTDEEFIPQHRILYFKRKSDGAIVWERRSRIDDIFGSGIRADS
ncbi:hypothetical protein BGZ63DRAFT_409803 [Mariannaea sp. PMI_226]|nr:hypothetical protein BGZ63DRAFT_409803 [Mariannaea sp. PMI_226]